MNQTIQHNGETLSVRYGRFIMSDGISVQLVDERGIPYATVIRNLTGAKPITMGEAGRWLGAYDMNNNGGSLLHTLVDAGVLHMTGQALPGGHCVYPLVWVSGAMREEVAQIMAPLRARPMPSGMADRIEILEVQFERAIEQHDMDEYVRLLGVADSLLCEGSNPTYRVWLWANGVRSKVSVKSDQVMRWGYRESTDEGWTSGGFTLWVEDGEILLECWDDGVDCDGRLSHEAVYVYHEDTGYLELRNRSQRDYQAEAAGY